MPEGHSIHRLAAAMTELFGGTRPRATSPQGRFTIGADLISGTAAGTAHAWGKHLLWPFGGEADLGEDGPAWLHIHLGLYGSWTFDGDESFVATESIGAPRLKIGEKEIEGAASRSWTPREPKDTVRLRLETDHGLADLTGPNACEILTGAEVRAILNRLGPDPIRNEDGDRAEFIARARKRKAPIGQLVMDQKVVAGPGNIYRAECLFRTGISPMRAGNRVSEARLGQLWDDLASTMADGVTTGIIHTNPYEVDGDESDQRFTVYHRTGRPCFECGTPISESLLATRRLFWCPTCQR